MRAAIENTPTKGSFEGANLRYGVISDIHANLAALRRVLKYLDAAQIDRILCLGDLISFGDQPAEVIDLVRMREDCVVIAGNHDRHLSHPPIPSLALQEAINRQYSGVQQSYIYDLPEQAVVDEFILLTHKTLDPTDDEILDLPAAQRCLARLATEYPNCKVCFFGHTHLPTYFDGGELVFPEGAEMSIQLPVNRPVLINPGAVGLSRNGGQECACGVFDSAGNRMTFVRMK